MKLPKENQQYSDVIEYILKVIGISIKYKSAPINYLQWVGRGFWAVLDQGLFAISNFLMNILLARWLPPAEYGAFAVAYSFFLLLGAFHTAVLTEPMLVFGEGRYAGKFRKYLGILLYGHWGLTSLIGLILVIAALLFWRFGSMGTAQALFGLAVAAPFILFLWLLRRAFYVHFRPQWAAIGGALYLLLMVAGMYGLYLGQWLSSFSGLVIMGVASVMVGFWFTMLLRPQWRFAESNPTFRVVANDHWKYGKWSLSTTALMWIPGNIYTILLPLWAGLEGSAALRAVMNLMMPIMHANSAISVLLLPAFARNLRTESKTGLNRLIRLALGLFLTGSLIYGCLIFLFRYDVMHLIYRDKYIQQTDLIILAALIPLSAGIVSVLGGVLKAMERPDFVFWSYMASSFVSLTVGLWLLATKGTLGAIVGMLLSSLTTAAAVAWFTIKSKG